MIQDDQDSSDEFEIGIEKAGGINFNQRQQVDQNYQFQISGGDANKEHGSFDNGDSDEQILSESEI